MSLRAIPVIVFAFILYNVIVLLGGVAPPEMMAKHLLPIPLVGRKVPITWGDILMALTLFMLFTEILKATYTSTTSLIDHGLSMLVFVACLIQFLLFESGATGVFLNITLATLIDVIAGYTSDGLIAKYDLVVLDDPRHAIPPYDAIVLLAPKRASPSGPVTVTPPSAAPLASIE